MNFQIFPPSSLDNSILTSVLVGLFIVWVMQETLGWGISGLIIPGYLASVFVIQPVTGAVIVLEAVLTWSVVQALSEQVPYNWPWTRLFGRDRFFNILLVSVAVRVVLEWGGFWEIQRTLGLVISWELYSMGLVLVPLLANSLWRSGLAAGLPRIGLPVLATWAILRFVLLRFTNLSLSNFELTYEDLAMDFVDSPRAYILLLVGAWIASVANLRWGWDFGGLIVPGLLTLCWLEPGKLMTTLAEAWVMAILFRAAVALPGVRRLDLTGVRSLIMAFALGYFLKYALAWVAPAIWPSLRPTDLFGFGYLLPTLIALRIVSHKDAAHVLIPCAVTSFAGFVAATLLGYGLAALFPAERTRGPEDNPASRDLALATVQQALTDNADPWPAPERLLRSSTPLVQGGRDGFGAMRVNPSGADLVVVSQLGPRGMAHAGLAVANHLNARGTWLCAPRSATCDPLREGLLEAAPVLEVGPGESTRLRVAPLLDAAPLVALLPGLVIEPADGGVSRLSLSLVDRIRLAERVWGEDPGPLEDIVGPSWSEDPTQERWRESPEARLLSSADPDAFHELVLAPWMHWLSGGPAADSALRVAAGMARRFGLRLGRAGDRTTLVGPSWRAMVRRDASPLLVSAPDVIQEPDTAALAMDLFLALNATGIALDAPSPHPTGLPSTRSPAHITALAILAELRASPRVLSVRGTRDVLDPGAEIVLSTGRPVPSGMARSGLAERLEALSAERGWSVAWYDGDPQRLSFQDPMNPLRAAAEAAAGDQLTVWASSPIRRDAAAALPREAP